MSACEILPFSAILPDTVIFDLDGTLVDSAPDMTGALNATLATLGLGPLADQAVRHMVGNGARKLIERGLEAHAKPVGKAGVDSLVDFFLDYYGDHIADHSQPFPAVPATLRWLAARGVKLGVCTNKAEALARRLLAALDLDQFFQPQAILGGDSLTVKKPDGRHILATIEALRGDIDRSVMIGDSAPDRNAARDAGLPVILVTFGYTAIPVLDLDPDSTISHYSELPAALSDLVTRRRA